MKTSFLTKAVSKAQINIDWVVLAALVLGGAAALWLVRPELKMLAKL